VLVHLGSSNYLERYKIYVTHVQQWRQQFDKLESVDLRYDRQIIVNPDLQGVAKQPPLSWSAARQAMAAGVKAAALVSHGAAPVTSAKTSARADADKSTTLHKATRSAVPAHRESRQHTTARRRVRHASARSVVKPAAAKSVLKRITDQGHTAAGKKKPSPSIAKGQEER
jgi:cell division protein FtsQ